MLDVGCGDGFFATTMFSQEERQEHDGIDINEREIQMAHGRKAYAHAVAGDVVTDTFPRSNYRSIFANCSLEHIPDLQGALVNLRQHADDGCTIIAFVPTKDWAQGMTFSGIPWLGKRLARKIDQIFRHEHLYDDVEWLQRFENAGWIVEEVTPVGLPPFLKTYEALLPFSVPNYVYRKIDGICWEPSEGSLFVGIKLVQCWLAKFLLAPLLALTHAVMRMGSKRDHAAEYMVVARRS
jgi:2-polyprenyl-3-methyl-5-hydroxy-6-metoxy-1,4-benzoquinol methylase